MLVLHQVSTKNKGVVSLLGCGWLGLPLATDLLANGFVVKGSTTSSSKLDEFKTLGIDPFLVQFHSSGEYPDFHNFLQADTLIISIPPGRRSPDGFGNYQAMINYVCKVLPETDISKLILISSTSVYPDNNSMVDEFSEILPDTDSGKLMAVAEGLLSELPLKVIILRLAGLIGPNRKPGKFFAGKTNIPNGLAPVNLIHRDDVIRLIKELIDNQQADGIYNGVAPAHPSKQDFYTEASKLEGLEKPEFIPEKISWKIVTSSRIEKELDFKFEKPEPQDWLNSD